MAMLVLGRVITIKPPSFGEWHFWFTLAIRIGTANKQIQVKFFFVFHLGFADPEEKSSNIRLKIKKPENEGCAPEKWWLQDDFFSKMVKFSGGHMNFLEGILYKSCRGSGEKPWSPSGFMMMIPNLNDTTTRSNDSHRWMARILGSFQRPSFTQWYSAGGRMEKLRQKRAADLENFGPLNFFTLEVSKDY